jgi:hypothetical protein
VCHKLTAFILKGEKVGDNACRAILHASSLTCNRPGLLLPNLGWTYRNTRLHFPRANISSLGGQCSHLWEPFPQRWVYYTVHHQTTVLMITAGNFDQNCHMSIQIEFGWTKCPPIEPLVPGRGLCQPLVLPRSPQSLESSWPLTIAFQHVVSLDEPVASMSLRKHLLPKSLPLTRKGQ